MRGCIRARVSRNDTWRSAESIFAIMTKDFWAVPRRRASMRDIAHWGNLGMSNVIFLADHARASTSSEAHNSPTKSLAEISPPDAEIIRFTRPSDGTCNPHSMRDSDALDVPTSSARSSSVMPARSRYDFKGCVIMLECYIERNSSVNSHVAPPATTVHMNCGTFAPMKKAKQGQHYLRQWREKRGLSLRKLAERLEVEPGGEPLITYASLSRIETGDQPFSEPVLNAIANALDVSRSMLLEMDPDKEGHVVDLLSKMDGPTRDQAVRMLELMLRSSAA